MAEFHLCHEMQDADFQPQSDNADSQPQHEMSNLVHNSNASFGDHHGNHTAVRGRGRPPTRGARLGYRFGPGCSRCSGHATL
jgi:hypothetical protein